MTHSMHISTEIKNRTRWHAVTGTINVDELIKHLQTLYQSPNFDSAMNALWDIREANSSLVTKEDVTVLIDFLVKQWGHNAKNKMALVAARDLEYGMSRMYQIMLEGQTTSKVAIFKNMQEAEDWIAKN